MAHERWVFPLDCPDCRSVSGYPFEATTMKGSVTTVRIGLRCRECRHEWELELETEPMHDSAKESHRA